MTKIRWFNLKKIAGVFAAVFFVTGFLFLDKGVTGNIILNNGYSFDPVSFVGLLFILCSAILAIYALKK